MYWNYVTFNIMKLLTNIAIGTSLSGATAEIENIGENALIVHQRITTIPKTYL